MYEKSFEMKHFRVFTYPDEPLPRLPKSLGVRRMKETAPTEAVGCMIDSGQEAKTGILAYPRFAPCSENGTGRVSSEGL